MKWLERFFNNLENKPEAEAEGVIEEKVEVPQELLEENPDEFDVEVTGYATYKIEKNDNYHESYNVRFDYNLVINVMGMKIEYEDYFDTVPNDIGEIDSYGRHRFYCTEEKAIQYLIKLLSERRDYIMERLESNVRFKIQRELREKRLEELRKSVKDGGKLNINMSFKMGKPKM